MEDKDKLFLVVYFGVKNMDVFKGTQALMGFATHLKNNVDDSVKTFVIPQRTTDEIRMEILNPENVSDEKIKELIDIYNELLQKYEKPQG